MQHSMEWRACRWNFSGHMGLLTTGAVGGITAGIEYSIMPLRLPQRVCKDTVREFRAAAAERYLDACILAHEGRRTAAIYLWGYVVEMMLKAAYFSAFGYDPDEEITRADLVAARHLAPSLGLIWTGNLHSIHDWGQLLVRTRASVPGLAYSDAAFASRVATTAYRIALLWTEILRYHKSVAYRHEVRQVSEAVEWFWDSHDLL